MKIWTGFSDGSLDVYFSETGKLLVQKENAHEVISIFLILIKEFHLVIFYSPNLPHTTFP